MNRDHAIRLTRRDPGRNHLGKRPALMGDLQRVDMNVAALLADGFGNPKLLRSVWTNQRGIVPGEFRQRLRQLLQPAVVCETTVVDCRVGSEHQFECAARRSWRATCYWD